METSPTPVQPVQTQDASTAQNAVEHNPKKTSRFWLFLSWGLLVVSSAANILMILVLIALGIAFVGMQAVFSDFKDLPDRLSEKTLIEGKSDQKIAIVDITGLIDQEMSQWVTKQLQAAEKDSRVKAVIIRISSPGGLVSSSDQIHYQLTQFAKKTNKPMVAFMQDIAASGGYYVAVACPQIIAEPTVLTGSIGVLMNHMVIKDLLEQKLGIQPVTLKSGEKKDWPSLFAPTTEEQKNYLEQKVILPAYQRFVTLVAEGRQHKISSEQVRLLADGSIFSALEAADKGLVDTVGYLEDVVEMLKQQANLTEPMVIEYTQRLTLLSTLMSETKSPLTSLTNQLDKLLTPQVLYLWDGKP